jgi:endoglycosylceramidase
VALASAAPALAAPPPLGHAGRWITDPQGRVVVLRGFNTVPGDERIQPSDIGMGPDNTRWLARNGFNTIRLGLYYARVEPQPGVYDDAYLDDYVRVQKQLARDGIYTLLDMHEDQLTRRYGTTGALPSRGFPDWFAIDDGLLNTGAPYPVGNYTNPALNRAWDNLWGNRNASDGVSLQLHFLRGWRRVARRFRDRPGVLGYDLFNEPWPGSQATACGTSQGCPPGGFDQTLLTRFTRRIVAGVRAVDRERLIFYEPNLLFDIGSATKVGDPGDPNAGFSYHAYCVQAFTNGNRPSPAVPCRAEEERVLENARDQIARTGDTQMLSEAGFDPNAARRITALADRRMLNWQWWDYYGDNLDFVKPALPNLIRPYPQVIAGTPKRWAYDVSAKRFTLAYSTSRVGGEGARAAAVAPGQRYPAGTRTTVFVPRLHFREGYRVEVRGARVVSAPRARRLLLASCASARRVSVALTPGTTPASARSCP